MSEDALEIISNDMKSLGINYEFLEWTSELVYPYFTGEYQEVPSPNENGEDETLFILTGFSRGNNAKLALEREKKKIKNCYPKVGGRLVSVGNGSTVAIFYSDSSFIPSGDKELDKIQINLTVKEWSVK